MIPIYRAKRVGDGKLIEAREIIIVEEVSMLFFNMKHSVVKVDSETLEVSINEKDWFSMKELSDILDGSQKSKSRLHRENGSSCK